MKSMSPTYVLQRKSELNTVKEKYICKALNIKTYLTILHPQKR
jgi:hypothetical protein